MLNPFICGSFQHQEGEDDPWGSPCSTPRKSRRSTKDSKNPYSARGLDKFSALLTDLDDKRRKIYSQMGSQDISFVRFMYSSANDCVPIVVKLKDHKQDKTKAGNIKVEPITHKTEVVDKLPIEAPVAEKEVKETDIKNEKKRFKWNLNLHKWRRPYYYMPVVIVLILLFLAFFGRSVAILCTSVLWYIVPTLKSSKRPTKKKEYVRRLTDTKLIHEEPSKKKEFARRFSEIKSVNDEPTKKKEFLRRFSDVKMMNDGTAKDKSLRLDGHRKSF